MRRIYILGLIIVSILLGTWSINRLCMNAYLSEEYSIGNGRIDEIVAKEYSSENATKEYITGE